MPRDPLFGAALASAALWHSLLVYAIASIAGAANLRHVEHAVIRSAASAKVSSSQPSATPCPCLVTPAPAMSPEQMQYHVVSMAADTAVLQGKAQIGVAAEEAAKASLQSIQALNASVVHQESKEALMMVIATEEKELQKMEAAEQQRQAVEKKKMEDGAKHIAQMSADHMRKTAESWASSQAYNYLAAAASGTLKDAMMTASQLPAIRQEATEYAKGAIQWSAETLTVAQKAQSVSALVPKARMDDAVTYATNLKTRQQALNANMNSVELREEEVNSLAIKAHNAALKALAQAITDEKQAKHYLETARENAKKIAKLKADAQVVSNEALKLTT